MSGTWTCGCEIVAALAALWAWIRKKRKGAK